MLYPSCVLPQVAALLVQDYRVKVNFFQWLAVNHASANKISRFAIILSKRQ